jgi:uncharacterized protein YjiS (DUF1127 family)
MQVLRLYVRPNLSQRSTAMSRTSCRSDIESGLGFAKAGHALAMVASWPGRVLRVLRERRQLAMLDEGMLKDIGISKADAYREWSRSFWDLPSELGTSERRRPSTCCE